MVQEDCSELRMYRLPLHQLAKKMLQESLSELMVN